MSTDPFDLHSFSFQTRLDIPPPQFPLSSNTSPLHPAAGEAIEPFQYASCPCCHSHRAKLTKHINDYKTSFNIHCPACGYRDIDVCDY
jgi:hypothetical protein